VSELVGLYPAYATRQAVTDKLLSGGEGPKGGTAVDQMSSAVQILIKAHHQPTYLRLATLATSPANAASIIYLVAFPAFPRQL